MDNFNLYLSKFIAAEKPSELKPIRQRRTLFLKKEESVLQSDDEENLCYEGNGVQGRPILSVAFNWRWKNALDLFLIILASLALVGVLAFLTG
ncbi:MAG TPA: hypothetical protein VNM22_15540 [Candidatus Limnocylindrales bacterium]|nr:hypothetical protein [Candidatus Limnocylindrales bacterium]